ncbi:MAG: hypothetical protein OEW91_06595 [Acidimicrobiia bacterium]|nr:hypothetical protein [Acidimicrobiia bacterium]
MTRPLATTAAMVLSVLVWSIAAARAASSGDLPWADDSMAVVAASLIVLASVATIGMLVGAARWAHRLGVVIAIGALGLGIGISVDGLWIAGAVLSGMAITGLTGTGMRGQVRKLDSASGPSALVVVYALGLIAFPLAVGLASPSGLRWSEWLAIAASAITALVYVKALPGALWLARILHPAALVVAAVGTTGYRWILYLAAALAAAWAAWQPDVRLAVRPIARTGTTVTIPPELAPREILDAAGIDDRGRPIR